MALRSVLSRGVASGRHAVPTLGAFQRSSVFSRVQSTSVSVVPKTTDQPNPMIGKFSDGYSWDEHQAEYRHDDPDARTYNYMIMGGARLIGASAGRLILIKLLAQMNPSKDVLALASLEVDTKNLVEGKSLTVKWRGKPVFIRYRTAEEIDDATGADINEMRDPQTDADRHKDGKAETLVLLGVCTHLGCVPITGAGDYNGWFCPCHGSHYDTSGRIRKGPAPYNLEVPPYKFLEDTKILVG